MSPEWEMTNDFKPVTASNGRGTVIILTGFREFTLTKYGMRASVTVSQVYRNEFHVRPLVMRGNTKVRGGRIESRKTLAGAMSAAKKQMAVLRKFVTQKGYSGLII